MSATNQVNYFAIANHHPLKAFLPKTAADFKSLKENLPAGPGWMRRAQLRVQTPSVWGCPCPPAAGRAAASPAVPNPPSAEPSVAPRELLLPKPREVLAGWAEPCENSELLWELLLRELLP